MIGFSIAQGTGGLGFRVSVIHTLTHGGYYVDPFIQAISVFVGRSSDGVSMAHRRI